MQFLPAELFDQMDRRTHLTLLLPLVPVSHPLLTPSPLWNRIIGFNSHASGLTYFPSLWPSWDGKFNLLQASTLSAYS